MFHKCLFRDLLKGTIPQDAPLLEDAEIKSYVEQYAADQVPVFFLLYSSCFQFVSDECFAWELGLEVKSVCNAGIWSSI